MQILGTMAFPKNNEMVMLLYITLAIAAAGYVHRCVEVQHATLTCTAVV